MSIKNKCGRCEKYFKINDLSFTTLYENCESSRYSIKLICPCCGFEKFTLEEEPDAIEDQSQAHGEGRLKK